jgi:MurNAc alpha-1-phosphate uridylyltransferase
MKTAMIFAAGRGERLRPLTETLPKALCPFKARPLIEYHLDNLAKAGFERVIINHAYLGGKIRHHLQHCLYDKLDIYYSPEPPGALETGGGIVNALDLLHDAPFVTINADIYTDFDYSRLCLKPDHLAHVVLVDNPGHGHKNDFGLSTTHLLQNHDRAYTFSGIACYHPALFKTYQPGRFSITPILRALAAQQLITGERHQGIWFDIGSLERLHAAEAQTKT